MEQLSLEFDAEVWRDIPEWEGFYQVSNQGRVKSLARTVVRGNGTLPVPERILRPALKKSGYLQVNLCRAGTERSYGVHQLVLLAFEGPSHGMETLHGNGVASDNRLPNLRYGTRSENMLDTVRHGTHRHADKTYCDAAHKFDAENTRTYRTPSGFGRACRTCNRTRSATWHARQAALAA